MKKIYSFFSIFIVASLSTIKAIDYTIGTSGTTTSSNYMPIAFDGTIYNSISQQLYFASELTEEGASAGTITAISFYYMSSTEKSRTCEVWIAGVSKKTELAASAGTESWMYSTSSTDKAPGTKVFDGTVSIPAESGWYTITFSSNFAWNGTENLVITINDKTNSRSHTASLNHKVYTTSKTTKPCGIYKTGASDAIFDASNTYDIKGMPVTYTPVIKFSIATAASVPAPTSPTATSITRSSATLGWTAAEGADSYEVRYGTTSGSLGDGTNVGNVTSYDISGLEANTKYYYQIRTVKNGEYSAWTAEANFTTSAHTHDDITFSKWTFSTTLPASAGNYYLTQNVTLTDNWDPAGSINLCLNGKTVNMGTYYGLIDGGVSVVIFDDDGDGSITSSNSSQTLLASGSTSSLTVKGCYIANSGGGNLLKAENNALVTTLCPVVLSDASNNTTIINANSNLIANIEITRSFTSAFYNTLCLPFSLDNSQLQSVFGSGYDLEEFVSSTLDSEELTLNFNKVTSLTTGKPYLIKPASDVSNPAFEGVNITATTPTDQTSDTYVSFHGVYAPTELTGGNHNILFLGAGNELFWPETTGNINGFRAYFELKGAAQKSAVRARIISGSTSAEGIDNLSRPSASDSRKLLINGHIFIRRGEHLYNAQGQLVK